MYFSRTRFITASSAVCIGILAFCVALEVAEASPSPKVPSVTLATVGIGKARWRLVALEGVESSRRRACFRVGFKPTSSSAFLFQGTSTCPLPKFEGSTDGTGRQERTVLGVAFPREVVRVHLNMGEAGQKNLLLRLLTKKQAQRIHVDRSDGGMSSCLGTPAYMRLRVMMWLGGLYTRLRMIRLSLVSQDEGETSLSLGMAKVGRKWRPESVRWALPSGAGTLGSRSSRPLRR